MACELVITERAAAEYSSIIDYLATVLKSPQAAANFMGAFEAQFDLVCASPEIFSISKMPELAAHEFRAVFVNNYLALYKHDRKKMTVYVVHIFHQSQNYSNYI